MFNPDEDYDDDYEGLDDDEIVELEQFDAFIDYLKDMPRAEVMVLNPIKVRQMRFAYALMAKALQETQSKAKIICEQHELESSVGIVSVEGASIEITSIEYFARAAEFANNTEVYPLSSNKVRLTFTFHELLKPAE